jgi:hypothetical protein
MFFLIMPEVFIKMHSNSLRAFAVYPGDFNDSITQRFGLCYLDKNFARLCD